MQRCSLVARQTNDERASFASGGDCSQHIGSAPAGGDAHQRVIHAHPQTIYIAPTCLSAVFEFLAGLREGKRATSDAGDYQIGRHVECGRTFRGVESAQTSRRPRADVYQSAATPEPVSDCFNRRRNCWQLVRHGIGHRRIFRIHELHNLERRHPVNLDTGGVRLFGRQPVERNVAVATNGHQAILLTWPVVYNTSASVEF